MLVMGLMENDRLEGSYEKSALKFSRHDLQSVEIQYDAQPIVHHPLKLDGKNCNDFFINYLSNTNRFQNPFSNGSLSLAAFEFSNFLVFTNLKNDGYNHGQLTLKLLFENLLPEKLLCIFIPIWEKKISFDSYLNASVIN